MLHFIKRLFKKKPVKLYPVAGEKKRRIPYTNESILFILLIVLIAMSCSPTASLPNGCKYKLIAPKFTK